MLPSWQTGTYAVVVDPQGSATGAVTITLHDVPADASGTVAFGSSAPVTTTVPGQNANVTFSGVAGQRASVVVSDVSFGTSTCCSLRISILKPNGSVLVTPVSAGSNGGFLDAVVLPTTGTYTIFVDRRGLSLGSATLTLYNVPADAATTIVPGGAPATVSTTVPGQNAGVTFAAGSNQKVSIKVGPSCCATRVSIIKPNGAVLVAAMTLGAGGGFMDTVTIPTTGTYTILVDLQGPATGDVTLTLYDVPADVTGTIAFGVPKTVTTTVPGQNASLTFTGTVGQVVSLVMAGGCCTTRISLLKPNGTVLVSPVSFGAAGGFLDATTLPNNGTYTIAIDPQGAATERSRSPCTRFPPKSPERCRLASPPRLRRRSRVRTSGYLRRHCRPSSELPARSQLLHHPDLTPQARRKCRSRRDELRDEPGVPGPGLTDHDWDVHRAPRSTGLVRGSDDGDGLRRAARRQGRSRSERRSA